jgi:hypothetical protein
MTSIKSSSTSSTNSVSGFDTSAYGAGTRDARLVRSRESDVPIERSKFDLRERLAHQRRGAVQARVVHDANVHSFAPERAGEQRREARPQVLSVAGGCDYPRRRAMPCRRRARSSRGEGRAQKATVSHRRQGWCPVCRFRAHAPAVPAAPTRCCNRPVDVVADIHEVESGSALEEERRTAVRSAPIRRCCDAVRGETWSRCSGLARVLE